MSLKSLFNSIQSYLSPKQPIVDPSLKQGLSYTNFQTDYDNLVASNLKLIEQTSQPNLSSIKETMQNRDSTQNPITELNKSELGKLDELEKQFNAILTKYSTAYKQYFTELLQTENNPNNKFRGKVVKIQSGGAFYYINRFGYTRQFSSDAWDHKDSSCPSTVTTISPSIFHSFKSGPSMGIGEPCGLEGTNINNDDTSAKAWVDVKGFRHEYPNEISWSNRKQSCTSSPSTVSNSQYEAIPISTEMTEETDCNTLATNQSMENYLVSLNAELISLSKQMYDEIEKITNVDNKVDENIKKQKKVLNEKILQLEKEKGTLENGLQHKFNAAADYEDYKIRTKTSYYHYLSWTLAALALGGITVHQMMK